MQYRKALQNLTTRIRPEDFAAALEVSVSGVRQAALPRSSSLARPAPRGWEKVAARLAREKARHFQRLAKELARKA
jgi:hypothetical protein